MNSRRSASLYRMAAGTTRLLGLSSGCSCACCGCQYAHMRSQTPKKFSHATARHHLPRSLSKLKCLPQLKDVYAQLLKLKLAIQSLSSREGRLSVLKPHRPFKSVILSASCILKLCSSTEKFSSKPGIAFQTEAQQQRSVFAILPGLLIQHLSVNWTVLTGSQRPQLHCCPAQHHKEKQLMHCLHPARLDRNQSGRYESPQEL